MGPGVSGHQKGVLRRPNERPWDHKKDSPLIITAAGESFRIFCLKIFKFYKTNKFLKGNFSNEIFWGPGIYAS